MQRPPIPGGMLPFGRVPKLPSLLQAQQSNTKRLTSPHGLTDQRTTGTTHSSCFFPPPTPARFLPFPRLLFPFSWFILSRVPSQTLSPVSFHHLAWLFPSSYLNRCVLILLYPHPRPPLSVSPPPRILSSVSFVYLYFTSHLAVRPSVVQ